mmetsp:Transcript_15885/g.25927  ORF Transcript_15885/g.25927 Transcript_15885/m.25927 type:complete len:258 (+) Transcript_15885:135-908(+)|eukprot:CAMPEP_0203746060 /NCGR_PEP_ID=MMETSP0098-20131031/1609_1 /ASSEMBLY_ACC=CAM_ASM_000208 /TAXON_ID=96639 /ORGANISM=" , Strain NY0313808BC1" /LENGTH=257 /DNA_ID=CAMNT_0050634025 /DNA_START=181 /DNA_END=954 /DNA_ORIENTATION=-
MKALRVVGSRGVLRHGLFVAGSPFKARPLPRMGSGFCRGFASADGKDAAPPSGAGAGEGEKVKSSEQVIQDALKLVLPDDGHEKVVLAAWLKKEGDSVLTSETVCEIETDDYIYDFTANTSGILAKILVKTGSEIKPHTTLAYLAPDEEEAQQLRDLLALQASEDSKEKNKKNIVENTPEDEEVDEEVLDFLQGLGDDMSRYYKQFMEDGFDSVSAIATLEEEDLKAMQVKKGHIRVLLKGIEELNKKEDDLLNKPK